MITKRKVFEWIKRYLPAEILSTAVTVIFGWITHLQGGGPVVVALISSWGGNLTYFGCILFSDILQSVKKLKTDGKKYSAASFAVNLRNMILEFGLAEILDSLLVRPFMMYYIPQLVSDFTTGIVIAKLLADVIFYIPAIIGYEMNRKYFDKPA